MNTPPLYEVCKANTAVVAIFQESPASQLRIWPFTHSEKHGFDIPVPYCVWQTIGGSPSNYLDCPPDQDNVTLQIDVYGGDPDTVREGANVIEAAIQDQAYITKYLTESFEKDTKLYRANFNVEWIVKR